VSKLRFGIIGAGGFAEVCHAPGLQSHPEAEVVALCGRRREHARAMADRLGIADVHTDYRELLARDDVDAVTIVTPNAAHAEQAVAAFEAGKHVFCEKPLGLDPTEAERMLVAARASGKVHMVAFTFRYTYGVRELRRRVAAGDIGRPHYVRLAFSSWGGLRPDWRIGWREVQALAGGGLLYDMGSHLFDLARFCLGPIEETCGVLLNLPRERPDARTGNPRPVETDDRCRTLFRHSSGVFGEWLLSRVTPPHGDNAYLEVAGDQGALQCSLSRGNVEGLRVSRPQAPSWETLPLPEEAADGAPHALGIMLRSFADAVRRGAPDGEVDAPFEDGVAAQQALAAVRRSAAERRWASLAETAGAD